ncbi:MAG: hypothetical protein KAU58_01530 [Candidatus Omnitrophica bacterium]|nr:hypothetical protein [Candidatus Omnitrophota bacterium]
MEKIIEKLIEHVPNDIFTDDVLVNLLPGTPDSRYGVVKRAIAKGEIIHIKKGLYALAKKYQRKGINLFELSQLIYGPSYISFESALNYHGWIPEAVYSITSACAKNAKEFSTPYGVFTYKRIPFPMLYLGVKRIESSGGTFLMANPWKALIDYVYVYKKEWRGIDPVIKSLRVEKESLENPDNELLAQLEEKYKNFRVKKFIKGLKQNLKL